MKAPAAKKYTHYSVLVMRDDAPARTYHVRCKTLRYVLSLFVVLLLLGAAGITGTILLSQEYYSLYKEHEQQDREIAEVKLQLERLMNLQSLLEARNGDIPQAKNQEVGVPAPASTANGQSAPRQNGDAAVLAPESTRTPAPQAEAATEPTAETTLSVNTEPSTAPVEQPAAPAAENATPSLQTETVATESSTSKAPYLKIENFTARPSGRELRLRYRLVAKENDSPDNRLTFIGTTRFRAHLLRGGIVILEPPRDANKFSLSSLKPVDISMPLPDTVQSNDIRRIEVILDFDKGGSQSESFPLDV